MDDPIVVCRLAEETPAVMWADFIETECSVCHRNALMEHNCEGKAVCIHCAFQSTTGHSLFVELPPDEWGHRSQAVSIAQVLAKDDGKWHKTGVWHDQQAVLNNIE